LSLVRASVGTWSNRVLDGARETPGNEDFHFVSRRFPIEPINSGKLPWFWSCPRCPTSNLNSIDLSSDPAAHLPSLPPIPPRQRGFNSIPNVFVPYPAKTRLSLQLKKSFLTLSQKHAGFRSLIVHLTRIGARGRRACLRCVNSQTNVQRERLLRSLKFHRKESSTCLSSGRTSHA